MLTPISPILPSSRSCRSTNNGCGSSFQAAVQVCNCNRSILSVPRFFSRCGRCRADRPPNTDPASDSRDWEATARRRAASWWRQATDSGRSARPGQSDPLAATVTIARGGIDEVDATVDGPMECLDRLGILLVVPSRRRSPRHRNQSRIPADHQVKGIAFASANRLLAFSLRSGLNEFRAPVGPACQDVRISKWVRGGLSKVPVDSDCPSAMGSTWGISLSENLRQGHSSPRKRKVSH